MKRLTSRIAEIVAHIPSGIVGVVVMEAHSLSKRSSHSRHTVRTERGSTHTFPPHELREATAEEAISFTKKTYRRPGFALLN